MPTNKKNSDSSSKKNQKGGEIDGSSKFNYDSIKLSKNINMSKIKTPQPPPVDCVIL